MSKGNQLQLTGGEISERELIILRLLCPSVREFLIVRLIQEGRRYSPLECRKHLNKFMTVGEVS